MITFIKMHANGNDFMIVDAWYTPKMPVVSPERIQKWSDRHIGIGFDQLLWVSQPTSKNTEAYCRIFNADGSEAGQCGHGMACVATWLYEKDYVKKPDFRIKTLVSICTVQLIQKRWVNIDLGKPVWKPAHIPLVAKKAHRIYQLVCPKEASNALKETYAILQKNQRTYLGQLKALLPHQSGLRAQAIVLQEDKALLCGILSLGNPHCIIPVNDVLNIPSALGPLLSKHPYFPQQTNVTFMQILTPHHILLKVYERGVGFNRACGSAACAAVIIGRLLGYLTEEVMVEFVSFGNKVTVRWEDLLASVQLKTQTHLIFEGQIA